MFSKLPIFSVMLNENKKSPHFRCKIKVYKFGTGTLISAEAVNAPDTPLIIHIKNEALTVNITNGYGFAATYSPLPVYSFSCKDFSVIL